MLDVKFEVCRKIDFVNIVLAKRSSSRKSSFPLFFDEKFFFFFTKNFLKIPLTLKRIGNNRQDRIIDKGLSRTPLCCWSELYGVLSRPWNFKIKFCHLPTAFVVSGVNFKSHLHRQLDIVHCSRTCDHAKIPFSLCISITWPAMEFFHLRFAS